VRIESSIKKTFRLICEKKEEKVSAVISDMINEYINEYKEQKDNEWGSIQKQLNELESEKQ
jgi:hypothetical protein